MVVFTIYPHNWKIKLTGCYMWKVVFTVRKWNIKINAETNNLQKKLSSLSSRMAAASQLKMKILKFNVPRCQVLTVPAHSRNWPLLSEGCVFQLQRCQKRDCIFLFECRWTKAQKNYLYCTETYRKPKPKLVVSLPNPSTMTIPHRCLLYSWNPAHFCFILMGQCTWCKTKN